MNKTNLIGKTQIEKDNSYTYSIQSLLFEQARAIDDGSFILNSMSECEFDINGNLQINQIIARACSSSFKISDIEYLLKVLPSKIKYPEINDNLKKYGEFNITGLVLDYDKFLTSAIKSNQIEKADYLYHTTPVNVNNIFYKFIKNGEIFACKRLFKLCVKFNNVKYHSGNITFNNSEENETNENKILTIIKITDKENSHYLRNNKKFKKTADWLNSIPDSLPKALEPTSDDYF